MEDYWITWFLHGKHVYHNEVSIQQMEVMFVPCVCQHMFETFPRCPQWTIEMGVRIYSQGEVH